MKVTCNYICAPKKKRAQCPEDITITVFLPFMPHPGMDLKITAEGDYYRVSDVYWDINTPDEVTVFFEEPGLGEPLESWEGMKTQGWSAMP